MSHWRLLFLVSAVVLGNVVLSPTYRAQDRYIPELSAQVELASVALGEAGEAIGACNDELVACLQDPEPYAQPVDNATVKLERVLANLTNMTVPAEHAANHAQLRAGFRDVIDGLVLYTIGLREKDIDKINQSAELVRAGRNEVETATAAILGRAPQNLDLILITVAAVAVTSVAIAVSLFVVVRESRRSRRDYLRNEFATCPKCGEVLDKWWTFKKRQIEDWRRDHIASHAVNK